MNRSWLLWGIISALLGALFMRFSKIIYFTGMVIFFVLSLTSQVSVLQSPEASEHSTMQSKKQFISAMCYLIAGILSLFI